MISQLSSLALDLDCALKACVAANGVRAMQKYYSAGWIDEHAAGSKLQLGSPAAIIICFRLVVIRFPSVHLQRDSYRHLR